MADKASLTSCLTIVGCTSFGHSSAFAACFRLAFAPSTAIGLRSQPIDGSPRVAAAKRLVPEPQQGSSTIVRSEEDHFDGAPAARARGRHARAANRSPR